MPRCFGQLVGMQARRLLTAQTSTQTETENSSTSSTVNVLTYHNDDARATSIANMFDLTMQPRAFVSIPSRLDEYYFEHKPISYAPVDRE